MRTIRFTKTLDVTAQVPDDFFHEDGTIDKYSIAIWVEQNGCQEELKEENGVYEQWQNGTGEVQEVKVYKKDVEYPTDKDIEMHLNKKDIDKQLKERDRAERCYECTGYGDDYDSEGNCNCDTCPFNDEDEDD